MSDLALPTRTIRNADLGTLVGILRQQHHAKVDVVVPAHKLRSEGGRIRVEGLEAIMDENGVTDPNGLYLPTKTADAQIGDKFDIPSKYMTRMRDEAIPLYDANVNGWAAKEIPSAAEGHKGRSFLLRLMMGDAGEGTNGILRAVLSDRYGASDNLDTAMALLKGMKEAGLDAHNIGAADLSDDRLYLRVEAPEISVMAPELLKGYRSPFSGQSGDDLPIVYAGLVFRNSETGNGALSVTPELKVQVCSNGLIMTKDAMRQVHLGQRLEQGTVAWSRETIAAEENLITAKVKDAVKSFLTPEYLETAVASLTEKAGKELKKPLDTVRVVARELRITESETEGLLDHFVRGAQMTAGGVMQAVTSFAQTIESVDRSNDFQALGVRAMELAARA